MTRSINWNAKSIPISLPETFELTIDRIGGLGDGVGVHEGKPVVLPKSTAGDTWQVEITGRDRERLFAHGIRLISAGPDRMHAPCLHYSACGGCALQHISLEAYRAFKTRMLHEALRKSGVPLDHAQVVFLPIASRRRVEFKLTEHGELALLAPRSHRKTPIRQCLILTSALQACLLPLQAALMQLPAPYYPSSVQLTDLGNGIDLLLRYRDKTETINMDNFHALPGVVRVSMEGQPYAPLTFRFGAYEVPLPPGAFLQASQEGQRALTDWVTTHAVGAQNVLDLFAGLGTYSFPLCEYAQVQAVEGSANLTAAMRKAIQVHGISTLRAITRDLFAKPLRGKELEGIEVAVVNPPFAGAKLQCEALAASGIPRIIMVSCNPATFTRDARTLLQAGFMLESAQGVDQFVWSAHLEIMAVFQRNL